MEDLTPKIYEFDRFRLDENERLFFYGERAVSLAPSKIWSPVREFHLPNTKKNHSPKLKANGVYLMCRFNKAEARGFAQKLRKLTKSDF